jgi:ribosomal silencing factor RsfS
MPKVKEMVSDKTAASPTMLKVSGKTHHVHVVVTMDSMTSSSVATIKKDMSEAVKRDMKVLRKFGLVTF